MPYVTPRFSGSRPDDGARMTYHPTRTPNLETPGRAFHLMSRANSHPAVAPIRAPNMVTKLCGVVRNPYNARPTGMAMNPPMGPDQSNPVRTMTAITAAENTRITNDTMKAQRITRYQAPAPRPRMMKQWPTRRFGGWIADDQGAPRPRGAHFWVRRRLTPAQSENPSPILRE
jgi:hypothetical protein